MFLVISQRLRLDIYVPRHWEVQEDVGTFQVIILKIVHKHVLNKVWQI